MQYQRTLNYSSFDWHFATVKSLAVLLLGLAVTVASGCGGNTVRVDQRGETLPGDESVPNHGAIEVVVAPGVAQDDTPEDVPEAAAVEVVSNDDGRPPAKTGLVRGLTQMLNSTPLQDDQKDSIRGQMEEADNILFNAKQQNQASMRQAFRQIRLGGMMSPNIIMIVADDLCLSDLNCYGHSEILTPNIDRLSKSGTRFTQAYSGSPESRDARWCLVAGRRPDLANVRNQGIAALQSDDITVAEVMWQAGYTTGVFGHWGVVSPNDVADPDGHGYDEWLGTYGLPDEPQPYPEFINHTGNKLRLTKNAMGRQGQFVQDFFVSEASRFLTRHAGRKPVFMQFFFSVPGVRRTVPKLEHYAEKNWPDAVKIRAAAITRMDRDLGTLIQSLEDLKQISNTVFVITSDTAGNPVFDPDSDTAANPTLRGQRGGLHEGGLRVPLIISGSSQIPKGMTSEVIAAAWDLPATIYQLAQVAKVPQRKQGQSLLPSLKPNVPVPGRFLKWDLAPNSQAIAIRWRDWKAIRLTDSAPWELYDLKADPLEAHNVAVENPEVIAEIIAKLPTTVSKVAGKP